MTQQEELKELFLYNYATGWFTNRYSRGRAKIGERAGAETGHGYRRIIVDYVKHYEHHLAWLYVHGVYPDEVDHKDGRRSNNAISNLRLATRVLNVANSERDTGISGFKGAYLDRRTMRWFSKIQFGMRTEWLGTFDTPEQAAEAYKEAAERQYGDFALHMRPTTFERRI